MNTAADIIIELIVCDGFPRNTVATTSEYKRLRECVEDLLVFAPDTGPGDVVRAARRLLETGEECDSEAVIAHLIDAVSRSPQRPELNMVLPKQEPRSTANDEAKSKAMAEIKVIMDRSRGWVQIRQADGTVKRVPQIPGYSLL